MKILLFGVSNVGKTTIGKKLAEVLGFEFHDLDEEVMMSFNTTIEKFVNTGTVESRDRKRGKLIGQLLQNEQNLVMAITPMSYPENFAPYLNRDDVLAIELQDTPKHIFDRLIFSDENDNTYEDDGYKNLHKDHYIKEIKEDILWYGIVFQNIKNKFDMKGDTLETVVGRLIRKYKLRITK